MDQQAHLAKPVAAPVAALVATATAVTATGAAGHAGEASDPLAVRPAAPPARPPLIASEALLRGHRSVEISHQGVLYRLQATRQGKLILTK